MRSRKILVAMLVGLLLVSVFGPAVSAGYTGSRPNNCSIQDIMEWLAKLFVWITSGRPDGPPPVPTCR